MTDDDIIRRILRAEGVNYTNDPTDPGGPTKFGVTLAALRRHKPSATAADVAQLTEPEAIAIYAADYITAPGFSIVSDTWLRWVVVDAGVNHGTLMAKRLVQRALGVKDDGVWGPLTRLALAQADQRKLAVRVCTMRQRYYAAIVAEKPTQVKYIKGWTDRAMDQIEELVAA
jgi:lysozyme family protein